MYKSQINTAITAHFHRTEEVITAAAASSVAAASRPIEALGKQTDEDGGPMPYQQQPAEQPLFLTEACLYKVEAAFSQDDLYWKDNVRGARFQSTLENGILYRTDIVDELVDKVKTVLAKPTATGIMVKGPQGIGKSHSLVNLVHKLVYGSNNKYLVTFIPDCEKWNTVHNLLDAICASSGISGDEIKQQIKGNDVVDDYVLTNFTSAVDAILKSMGKQWVFVFDQINKLFVKPINLQAKDASSLAFPFNFIKLIMKPGRITSIISASANNELAYKEAHEGFSEFLHSVNMKDSELCTCFDAIDDTNVEYIVEVTAGVPLYVASFSEEFQFSQDEYESERVSEVRSSLRKLKESKNWEEIKRSILSGVLQLNTAEDLYDKKFFVQSKEHGRYRYLPLIPQVKTACRSYLWDDLMQFVAEKESTLLDICRDPNTTNRARGDFFEAMVIRRCTCNTMTFEVEKDRIAIPGGTASGFPGSLLPDCLSNDCFYYPLNPNFPAIDFVVKCKSNVFFFQVHVSCHKDVTSLLLGMCKQKGWFNHFDKIYLIYLSPEEEVSDLVQALVKPPVYTPDKTRQDPGPETGRQPCITRRAMCKDSITCLKDLQWPDGCSLHSS